MSRLNKDQQDLILDFYFRCGDEQSINKGRDLIAANPEAAKLYDNLEGTLKELDAVKYEPCPNNLVELTIVRLKDAASQDQRRPLDDELSPPQFPISDLIRAEQNKPNLPFPQLPSQIKPRIFKFRVLEIAAVAAIFLAVSGIGLPVFSNLRQTSWENACLANFANIGQSFTRFAGDHNGLLPSVPMTAGAPWYKVGEQGSENQSNTRHLWVLIKLGYASPADFVCPGFRQARIFRGDSNAIAQLNDFPCHRSIGYSLQLLVGNQNPDLSGNPLLMADRNPLFEKVCTCCGSDRPVQYQEFQLCPNPDQLIQTSNNHPGRGQNVLYSDGSARFLKDRIVGGDDIYGLKGITLYRGNEIPRINSLDIFLVP